MSAAAPVVPVPPAAATRLRVVLLHGWGSRGEVFAALAEALAAHFDVLVLDLPAHGAASGEAFPREEAALLGWMRERIPAGAVLAGWSLGGALGLRFAQAFPGHLAALVTIATSPCFLQREDWSVGMDAASFEAFRAGLLADAQALADGEEDRLGQAAAHQVHATPHRLAAPEAEHLEEHAPAARAVGEDQIGHAEPCLLYTSPSPRD